MPCYYFIPPNIKSWLSPSLDHQAPPLRPPTHNGQPALASYRRSPPKIAEASLPNVDAGTHGSVTAVFTPNTRSASPCHHLHIHLHHLPRCQGKQRNRLPHPPVNRFKQKTPVHYALHHLSNQNVIKDTHTHRHTRTHPHSCIPTHIHTPPTHTHSYTQTRPYMHEHCHTNIYTHTHARTRIPTYTLHIHTNTHTHARAHTHTYTLSSHTRDYYH